MEIKSNALLNQTGFCLIGKMVSLNDFQKLQNYCNNLKITSDFLIIDIHRLTFASSHGLGIFITIAKTMQKVGKQLILFNPLDDVLSVCKIIGIDVVVPVMQNLEDLQNYLLNYNAFATRE